MTTSILLLGLTCLNAQNPLIMDQFTADPTARVFNSKVYVYPSHDIPAPPEKQGRKDWFCMADYHVFSSENMTDWTDHGVIISQNKVNWVDSTAYSMWAPDCMERNGKYYFYFPAIKNSPDANGRKGFGIGVAVGNKPEGPFIPQPEPIKGVFGIDPNVFIDKDGQAYLYYSLRNIFVAKLKENMIEIDSEPLLISNLPEKGLKEGSFLFERKGIYYLTFPHVNDTIERLEYAMGNSPIGPFKMSGVLMDESPSHCWTNHQSVIEYQNQWYLFYHDNDLSPEFDKNRSVRADSLFFNEDGTIRKVKPTLRGVGISNATSKIQIDRYSDCSKTGINLNFVDESKKMNGWKVALTGKNSWLRYNSVKFDKLASKIIKINGLAKKKCTFTVRVDHLNGPIVAQVNIPASINWDIISSSLKEIPTGIHDIFITMNNAAEVNIDWISFE